MNDIKFLYNTLVSQYSTEKTVNLVSSLNCFTFVVSNDSNKNSVKKVVEKLFNVIVLSVKIINVKGKSVRFKNSFGKKKDFKKACVYLADGHSINFSEFK